MRMIFIIRLLFQTVMGSRYEDIALLDLLVFRNKTTRHRRQYAKSRIHQHGFSVARKTRRTIRWARPTGDVPTSRILPTKQEP